MTVDISRIPIRLIFHFKVTNKMTVDISGITIR